MKKNFLIIIFLLILINITTAQRRITKGFEYINNKKYSKALKLFDKSIRKQKNVAAAKFGIAVIYTRPDYKTQNFYLAYKSLEYAKKRMREYNNLKRKKYKEKFNISFLTIDSLQDWIVEREYEKTMEEDNAKAWNYFIDLYTDSKYAPKVKHHRDSILFNNVKADGSLFAFKKYINDYPNSIFIEQAIEQKNKVWKKKYDDAFKTLEFTAIQQFQNFYPDYPFYNDSTQKYISYARRAAKLKMHFGFLESTKPYYVRFIKDVAPHEMAFQALLCLIQPQIIDNNLNQAIDTINKYKVYFGDYYKIDSLLKILKRPKSEIEYFSVSDKINTNGNEYMPVLSTDDSTLFFCGENRTDNIGGEDIYFSTFDKNEWKKPYLIRELSTSYSNEAPLAISADGNSLIVFSNGDIFISEKSKAGWTKPRPFKEISTRKNWEADALISADGNAIFFATDSKNNIGPFFKFNQFYHGDYIGNLDIYVITKKDDGTWSEPINLGEKINTPYAERTPFLHPDMKTLYFASDGHPGVGKLDLFKSTRLNDSSWTQWSEPINLGLGINSPKKEYGYRISTDGTKAYFTKFTENQADLYYTFLPENTRPNKVALITGKVINENNKPIQAEIVWENLDNSKKLGTLKSDPITGEYIITLPLGKNYGFYVSKNNYYPVSDNIDLTTENDNIKIHKNFTLIKIDEIIEGKASIELHNVFFDFDKYNLKPTSFPELNRLAEFIKSHNNVIVEISGHTDNLGSESYNKKLSKNRAISVKNYLIEQGCNPKQLIAKGYGDNKPVADNSTDQGRQKNRRVEFKVIKK